MMNKNTTSFNISSATASSAIANLKELNLDCSTSADGISDSWAPWTGSNRCPHCGSNKIEYNTLITLTTCPAQSQLRCKDCGHMFGSGFTAEWTNNDALNKLWEHDQSILGIPQVGDWPPTPTPQDPIYIPHTPDTHNYGWICPKCRRSLAPHVDSCPFCNEATPINITY